MKSESLYWGRLTNCELSERSVKMIFSFRLAGVEMSCWLWCGKGLLLWALCVLLCRHYLLSTNPGVVQLYCSDKHNSPLYVNTHMQDLCFFFCIMMNMLENAERVGLRGCCRVELQGRIFKTRPLRSLHPRVYKRTQLIMEQRSTPN